jgi:hypothetical protein
MCVAVFLFYGSINNVARVFVFPCSLLLSFFLSLAIICMYFFIFFILLDVLAAHHCHFL